MNKLVIRNDDVNPSTDFKKLDEMYRAIKEIVPDAEIWSCVNIIGKKNNKEAVYPDLPLSRLPLSYFYNSDALFTMPDIFLHRIVSHGLLHVKHTKLSRQAQEMSIVTSCRLLNTDIFVPPFSDYNDATDYICTINGITMAKKTDGWKSLEVEPFNPEHKLWFFHSWRMSADKLYDTLRGVRAVKI